MKAALPFAKSLVLLQQRHMVILKCSYSTGHEWISLCIKTISNELDITFQVIASQLFGHRDVISNRLWRHHQNVNRANKTQGRCVKIIVFIIIYGFVMSWNKLMYVLSWQTVSVLTQVLFWCLFPLLLHNSGNKLQNNPLVSAETICHSSTCIILYVIQAAAHPAGVSWLPVQL